MRDCPILSVVAVASLALSHQAFASPVELRSRPSKRSVEPEMIYDLNTISTCTFWYDNYHGRSCKDVRDDTFNVSPEAFSRWNPSITLDCGNWQERNVWRVRRLQHFQSPDQEHVASSIHYMDRRSNPSFRLRRHHDHHCPYHRPHRQRRTQAR
ncbi:WSC domain-containing protein [Apiospora saccharicola]|uniref:WSC domain-containing protein n=1 Tax=Apiospora saccharicola TaxID=335842 RepID=A0ABR1UXB8_9PEZI